MNHFKLALSVFVIFSTSLVNAEKVEENLRDLNFCAVTKTTMNDYEPEKFESSNNLLRKAGQEAMFCGEKIIIHGKVLDQNRVPVADAKVYMWQASCNGKYPYKPLKDIAKKNLIDINRNFTFTGNGTATTNNKGEFIFVTTYPPAMLGLASHVDVRVEHYMLGTIQTTVMLNGKKVSEPSSKPEFDSVIEALGNTDTSIYNFEIVLPGTGIKGYTDMSD